MINGIDLYHGNTMPDLSTYDFVFHKCTQGLSILDPLCQQRIGTVRASGKVAGMYHFLGSDTDPVLQAEYFVSNADLQFGDVVALDFEDDGGWPGLTYAEIAELGHQFMYAMYSDAADYRVILYCNVDTYNNIVVPFGVPINDGLWIAHPGQEPALGQVIWQYASTTYDQDKAYFADLASMRTWAEQPASPVRGGPQQFILTEE